MWTENKIKELSRQGKISGYKITGTKKGRKILLSKKGKQHYWMEMNLQYWCNDQAIELTREFQFHPSRKFRFDWAIAALKIGIEFEGIMSDKSRHTTVTGYSRDAEKYNLAQAEGWKVFRYTVLNYKNVIGELNSVIEKITNQ